MFLFCLQSPSLIDATICILFGKVLYYLYEFLSIHLIGKFFFFVNNTPTAVIHRLSNKASGEGNFSVYLQNWFPVLIFGLQYFYSSVNAFLYASKQHSSCSYAVIFINKAYFEIDFRVQIMVFEYWFTQRFIRFIFPIR